MVSKVRLLFHKHTIALSYYFAFYGVCFMCCRRWGFYGFMKDLFTAPDEVMRYLCQNYHLHDIPLGNDWTDKNADKVGVDLGTVVS